MLSKLFKKSAVFLFISIFITQGIVPVGWAKTKLHKEATEKLKTFIHLAGEPHSVYNPMAIDEIFKLTQAIKAHPDDHPLHSLYVGILTSTNEHLKTSSTISKSPMFVTAQIYELLFLNLISYRESLFDLINKHATKIPMDEELSLSMQAVSFNKPLTQKEEDQVLEQLVPRLNESIDSIFSRAAADNDDEVFNDLFIALLNQADLSKNNRLLSLFYLRKALNIYFTGSAQFQDLMSSKVLHTMPPLMSEQTDSSWRLLGFPSAQDYKQFRVSSLKMRNRTSGLAEDIKAKHPDFFTIEFTDTLSAGNWYSDFLETVATNEPETDLDSESDIFTVQRDLSTLYDIMGDLVDSFQISYFFLTNNSDIEDLDDIDDFERLPDHQFLQKAVEQIVFEDSSSFMKSLYLKAIFDFVTVSEMHDPISVEAQRRLTALFDYGKEHNSQHFLKKIAFAALTEKTYDPVVRLSAFNYLNVKTTDSSERSLILKWKKEILENHPLILSHTLDSEFGFELYINGESIQPDFLPLAISEQWQTSLSGSDESVASDALMCKSFLL